MTEDKSRPTLRQTDFLPARFSGTRHDRDDTTAHFFLQTIMHSTQFYVVLCCALKNNIVFN